MSTAEMRNLRRYIIISVISTILPFLLINTGIVIRDHYQIKVNTEIIKTLQTNSVSFSTLKLYVDAINEQTKAIKEDGLNNREEIRATQKRIDDIILSSKRGGSSATGKLEK
jgi:hypothetical protein